MLSDDSHLPSDEDPRPLSLPCLICAEDLELDQLILLPCNHTYCRRCLERAVQLAVGVDGTFPPQCCEVPFPEHLYTSLVTAERLNQAVDRAAQRSQEKPRLFCHDASCSSFIPGTTYCAELYDAATCPRCGDSTCVGCGRARHVGSRCRPPSWMQDQKLRGFMEKESIRRCPGCGALCSRANGCAHMTCPTCKVQFCWDCGAKYGHCPCSRKEMERQRMLDGVLRGLHANAAASRSMERMRIWEDIERSASIQRASSTASNISNNNSANSNSLGLVLDDASATGNFTVGSLENRVAHGTQTQRNEEFRAWVQERSRRQRRDWSRQEEIADSLSRPITPARESEPHSRSHSHSSGNSGTSSNIIIMPQSGRRRKSQGVGVRTPRHSNSTGDLVRPVPVLQMALPTTWVWAPVTLPAPPPQSQLQLQPQNLPPRQTLQQAPLLAPTWSGQSTNPGMLRFARPTLNPLGLHTAGGITMGLNRLQIQDGQPAMVSQENTAPSWWTSSDVTTGDAGLHAHPAPRQALSEVTAPQNQNHGLALTLELDLTGGTLQGQQRP